MMKAVIYARYSDDNQREESIEGQLRECCEYAKYHVFITISPRSQRTELLRLFSQFSCNPIDILLFL